jgi:hypothetical protein
MAKPTEPTAAVVSQPVAPVATPAPAPEAPRQSIAEALGIVAAPAAAVISRAAAVVSGYFVKFIAVRDATIEAIAAKHASGKGATVVRCELSGMVPGMLVSNIAIAVKPNQQTVCYLPSVTVGRGRIDVLVPDDDSERENDTAPDYATMTNEQIGEYIRAQAAKQHTTSASATPADPGSKLENAIITAYAEALHMVRTGKASSIYGRRWPLSL